MLYRSKCATHHQQTSSIIRMVFVCIIYIYGNYTPCISSNSCLTIRAVNMDTHSYTRILYEYSRILRLYSYLLESQTMFAETGCKAAGPVTLTTTDRHTHTHIHTHTHTHYHDSNEQTKFVICKYVSMRAHACVRSQFVVSIVQIWIIHRNVIVRN